MDQEIDVNNHIIVANDQLDCTANCTINDQPILKSTTGTCAFGNVEFNLYAATTSERNKEEDLSTVNDLVTNSEVQESFTESGSDQLKSCDSNSGMDEEENCEGEVISSFTKSKSKKFRVLDSDSEEDEQDLQSKTNDHRNEIEVCLMLFL